MAYEAQRHEGTAHSKDEGGIPTPKGRIDVGAPPTQEKIQK